MLSVWDVPKIDAVMEHGFPDESDRIAWQRIKKEYEELAQQSTNTQSTPCCSKCKSERVTITCNECGFVHCM